MKHIGLFEGIGGFSEAIEQIGGETIAWCEWNEFGKIILSEKYPNAKQHHDITETDFTSYRGRCDIVTGGFPCQPFSVAGEQRGTDDNRYLWPEMLRAIREIQPRWVVAENVRGLVSWSDGLVFEQVCTDLESEGYEVFPVILPAASVNAPHKRERIWFIAFKNTNQNGRASEFRQKESSIGKLGNIGTGNNERVQAYNGEAEVITYSTSSRYEEWRETSRREDSKEIGARVDSSIKRFSNDGITPNSCNQRLEGSEIRGSFERLREDNIKQSSGRICATWQNFPTQSPVCDGDDGFCTESLRQRIREDSMGALSEKEIDKIFSEAVSEWRKETIKAGGNAIVPQVFLQILKTIEIINDIF